MEEGGTIAYDTDKTIQENKKIQTTQVLIHKSIQTINTTIETNDEECQTILSEPLYRIIDGTDEKKYNTKSEHYSREIILSWDEINSKGLKYPDNAPHYCSPGPYYNEQQLFRYVYKRFNK